MMMQNVRAIKTKKLRTIEIEQSESAPGGGTSQSVAKSTMEPLSNFAQDMSGSDEDEASEVDSFILEENDIDENEQGESKFLLAAETEGQGIQSVDPQTQARLEALLEAAGISKLSSKDGKALSDPEVLRTLTSSVSSALDEAAQALHRMRDSQGQPLSSDGVPLETSGESESIGPRSGSGNAADSSEEGESLLSLACSAGYYELAQVLLAMKANVEDRGIKGDCTPLMEAASGGHVDIVRLLLVHKADINAQSSAGNTPLHYGACGGFKEVVEELIMNGANVEIHNENGHTPLMEAASAGHVEVAKILLDHGAGINTHSNEFKESALTLACYKGHLDMVKFLLEAGADQEHKTDEMHTALMEASMDGHVEVARLLLDSGAQVNMPADSFESPLTLAACGGHLELASLLLERGANIEEVNDEGYTPLMEAAREGHEEMVALLLSQEADINAQTEETQETALTLACCGGFLEVADYLLRQGAHIELGCSTPLMEAAQEGHLELVSFLLHSGANVEAQTGTGDTALTYACENGHTDVAEALLECGAKLEHESEGGRTPLMKAARAGHLCTVQFLISKGADVNRATTSNDHTVLSLACAGGHLAVVELLLAHHADAKHKLKDGSTMVIEAAKGGHTQVVKLLLEWPNRFMVNSTTTDQLSQLNVADIPLEEPRVPVQGLANIVPPSEPDSQSPVSTPSLPSAIQGKNPEALRQGFIKLQKSLADPKACNKTSSPVITENFQQLINDGMLLDDRSSEKDDKICLSQATKEEQILRKQQILEELKKVEKELHEKAYAQMLLSTQQDLEQQQLIKLKQGSSASPTSSNVTCVGNSTTTVLSTAGKADQLVPAYVPHLPQQLLLQQQQHQNQLSCTATVAPPPPPLTSAAPLTIPSSSATSVENRGGPKNQGNKRNGSNKQARSAKSNAQPPPPPPPPQPAAVHSVKGPLLLPLAGTPQHQALLSPVQPIVFQTEHNGEVSQIVASTSQVPLDTAQRTQLQAIQVQQQQQQQQQASLVYPQLTPQQSDQFLQLNTAQHMLTHQQGLQHQLQIQQLSQQVQSGQHVLTSVANTQVSAAAAQSQLSQQQQHVFQQQQQQAQQLFQQQLHQLKAPNPAGNNTIAINKPQVVRKQQRVVQPATQNLIQQNAVNVDGAVPPSGIQNLGAAPAAVDNNTPYSSVLVDSQTESNHDTALTLACAGGHAELVSLLLAKGADIEHRDKKGFTPLILSATAGHVDVVEILLDHGADIEAQSERTKDTPLSLACSGGRYEVVDLLLRKGANKEHRNVSDYTPLSLAASGGYVNIIKLLLHENAEINSRTGSKLGISPLMLAAMNGHTAAVKLLLDMGSDINAQIETNRNTALTLACFQGRHEVVSLLVDRKANIEHRAKTGLTPLMEAASGGYVEVGRVLLDKGADVNAPPVPSSRDTALTIAADKGHYRFVELLLHRNAAVDVKNKKGNSPLWLACNGGHSDVVSLLVQADADIDSQDNRKVSCLMAAFRRGHLKVVKWMVKKVTQFPSESEIKRYISTLTDNELQKKCNQCAEVIVTAKDMQAAEANKNADSLLEEIKQEKEKAALQAEMASKRRERRRERKRKGKQKDDKDDCGKNSSPEPESDSQNKKEEEEEEEEEDDSNSESNSLANTNSLKNSNSSNKSSGKTSSNTVQSNNSSQSTSVHDNQLQQRCPEITSTPVTPVVPTREAMVNGPTKTSSSAARANRESRKKQQKAARENRREAPQETEVLRSRLEEKKKVTAALTTMINAVVTSTPAITSLSASKANTTTSGSSGNGLPHSSCPPSSSCSSSTSTSSYPTPSKSSRNSGNNSRNNASTSTTSSVPSNVRENAEHKSSSSNVNGGGNKTRSKKSDIIKQSSTTGIGDLDDFGVVPKVMKGLDENLVVKEMEKYNNKANQKKASDNKKELWPNDDHRYIEKALANASNRLTQSAPSPRKGQKKEEGWKEVVRKNVTKKLMVPANVTARLIGKGGCHINAIREISGAHVEVEKAKGMADRSVTIKGSQESIRQAHNLINAMIEEPDKDISDILTKTGAKGGHNVKAVVEKVQTQQQKVTPSSSIADFAIGTFTLPTTSSSSGNSHGTSSLSSAKSPAVVKSHRGSGSQSSGHSGPSSNSSGVTTMGIGAWQNPVPGQPTPSSPRRSPQKQVITNPSPIGGGRLPISGVEKTSSRQLIFTSTASDRSNKTSIPSSSSNMASLSFTVTTTNTFRSGLVTSSPSAMTNPTMNRMHPDTRVSLGAQSKSTMSTSGPMSSNHPVRIQQQQQQQVAQMNPSPRVEPMPLPIVTSSNPHPERVQQPSQSQPAEYSPFNDNLFPNFLSKKEEHSDKMDFASVAAAGVVSTGSSSQPNSNPVPIVSNINDGGNTIDPALQAKAPGFKIPQRGNSPPYKNDNTIENNVIGGMRGNPNVSNMNSAAAVGNPVRQQPMTHQMMEEYHRINMMRQQLNQLREKNFMMRPTNMMGGGLMYPHAMGGIPMPPGHQQQLPPKEEYSQPHRPMTLPEIKGALNPNAPEFQLSAGPPMMNGYERAMGGMMGAPLMGMSGSGTMEHQNHPSMAMMMGSSDHVQNLSPNPGMAGLGQALPPMMQPGEMLGASNPSMQFLLQQGRVPASGGMVNNGSPPQMPGSHRLSSSLNAGTGQNSQSHNSPPHQALMGNPGLSPAPGNAAPASFMAGNPQRNPSPLSSMTGGRPNSAPSAQPDPAMNPGPIGPPPRVGSPSRPPPSEQQAKQIQPIGGERKRVSVRPGGPSQPNHYGSSGALWNFNGSSEYNNPEWPNGGSPVMTAAPLPSSVITSSVVGGSHMVYPHGSENDVEGLQDYGLQQPTTHHFKDTSGMMVGGDGDHSKRHIPNMMLPDNMYTNGAYMMGPMFPQPKGGAGDSHGAAIWNSGMAQVPNDQTDNERWQSQSWSQQTEI